jgi:cytoskeletal protein CcmA (bactofilin family)
VFKRRKPEEPSVPPTSPARGHVIASGLADPALRSRQGGMFEQPATAPAGELDATLAIPAMPEPTRSPTSPVAPTPPQPKEPPTMSIQPRPTTPTPTVTPPMGATPNMSRAPMAPVRMPQTSGDRRTLVVGRGISVQGTITDAERLVVEGTVEASSLNATELQIAQGGILKGTVEVEDAEISGHMDGTLTVRGSLVVRATGQVTGEARCRRLQVEDGGQLSGKISMITDGASAPAPHPAAEVSAG